MGCVTINPTARLQPVMDDYHANLHCCEKLPVSHKLCDALSEPVDSGK
jgi:hypothetical protein